LKATASFHKFSIILILLGILTILDGRGDKFANTITRFQFASFLMTSYVEGCLSFARKFFFFFVTNYKNNWVEVWYFWYYYKNTSVEVMSVLQQLSLNKIRNGRRNDSLVVVIITKY